MYVCVCVQVLCGFSVYIKFAGAAVECLRRWLSADCIPCNDRLESEFLETVHWYCSVVQCGCKGGEREEEEEREKERGREGEGEGEGVGEWDEGRRKGEGGKER